MDDESAPKTDYLAPYRDAIRTHGASFGATLWKSKATQTIRFDVLASMVNLQGLRLLDAGCGLGDLHEHLAHRGIRLGHYIGIDGMLRLIEKALGRHLPNAEFLVGDFVSEPSVLRTGQPDIIFFSGSLNTLSEDEARNIVRYAFGIARGGVVFNFLSDRCSAAMLEADTGPAARFDTMDWINWAMESTTDVAFRQDYLAGHDATIAMFKPNHPQLDNRAPAVSE